METCKMAENEFILLRRFAINGDAVAFSKIVKQHAPLVYGVCLRVLGNKDNAADAVQETFLQLVRDAAQITGSLPNWLHRTATNRAIDVIRQDSQRKKREFNYSVRSANIDSEDNKALWREISVIIDEELENLDDQTREVLILHFFENLATNDIAEKCGISQMTVYRWIESGIELLRLKLKSRGVIVPAALFMALLSENIVQAAPASIMKELGKIAIAGNKTDAPRNGIGIPAGAMIIIVFAVIVAGLGFMYRSQINIPENITISELLDKYSSSNKKFETIYYDLETSVQIGSEKYVFSFQYCSDNEKRQWIGNLKCYKEDGSVNQNVSTLMVNIIDNKMGIYLQNYNPDRKSKNPPKALMLKGDRRALFLHQYDELASHGSPLKGKLDGSNNQSIYDLLKSDSNVKLIPTITKVLTYDCYLIEAHTKYGIIKAWISPELDYNCLKWEITKNQNQFYRDGTTTNDEFTKWTANFEAEKVEQIEGNYIVTQAKFNHIVKNDNKILGDHTYHYNLKNVDMNPDYAALKAFEIQLPEGTIVMDEDMPGVQFRWTNGKLVSEDEYLDALEQKSL